MSEPEAPKPEEADKGKAPSSGNKLLLIIALGNFLGVFALGGYLAYDKLIASKHAAAQAGEEKKEGEHGEKKEGEHGAAAEEKAEGHGEEQKEEGGEHGGGHGEEKKAEGHGGGEADESIDPPDSPGPIMPLEPIVTNLADEDNDRYLKATLSLRVTSESAKGEVEAQLVPIRSAILMYLSSLKVSDIMGAEKRKVVQTQLRRIANEAMPASRVKFVYFTEFVVQ